MIRKLISTNPPGHLASQRLSLSNSPLNAEATPLWPRYTQKQDKHAVLDALASTIKPITPPLMFGHGPSDPYFLHNSRLSLLQYAQHWLAGKNAANYVIDRNPDLFPGFRAVPEVVPDVEPPPSAEPSLERLEYLIRLGFAEESYSLYMLLKTEHSHVSIPPDLLDNLLELMAYKCVGGDYKLMDDRRRRKIPSKSFETPDPRNDQELEPAYFSDSSKKWKKDGPCDQLFQEMKELQVATADSYNSMLMGKFHYDSATKFYTLYEEMLEQNLQPSLLVHNSFLSLVTSIRKDSGLSSSEKLPLIQRTIQRMNTEPLVLPDVDTFTILTRFANSGPSVTGDFPPSFQVFREMLGRDFKPNLYQLTTILCCNTTYLNELIDYVKRNPDVLRFSTELYQQNFLATAMEIAIANRQDHHVEYVSQLNRETFGLLDCRGPGVVRYYVNYKFGFWDVLGQPKLADRMCQILREYIQLSGAPCLPEIELATKFFQIGRYDLFLKVMREAFVVHDKSGRSMLAELLRIFNGYLSSHLLPNIAPHSQLMKESADFVWLLLSRFERLPGIRESAEFFELCRLSLRIFKPLDQLRCKRITKWLSLNKNSVEKGSKY